MYTWNFHRALIESALAKGAHGYLSKTLPARDLVAAVEAVAAGEIVISEPPPHSGPASGLESPGRTGGLTDREAEVLALISDRRPRHMCSVAAFTGIFP
jgi:DNA-binding NarL/FixJ family response regulator